MKCKNTAYDHECHSVYARKYDGFCLVCSNAHVPELIAERDRLVEVITKAGMQELIRFERAGAIAAFNILSKKLNWNSGGLESAAQECVDQLDRLEKAYGILRDGLIQWDGWAGVKLTLRLADAARRGE